MICSSPAMALCVALRASDEQAWLHSSGLFDSIGSARRISLRSSQNRQVTARGAQSSRYGIFEGPAHSKDDSVQRTMEKFHEGNTGPPIRVLPIGGLGEIGMNCMLVGHYDRYIMIDAGLMFPDFEDLGMVKVLPDTDFIRRWKHKIEAVIITHGHEDHIGALPWVFPALDPQTPIYSTSFTLELIKKRLKEYNFPFEHRCRTFKMRSPFKAGPFQAEAIRVTHSIPDSCGLVLRCDDGTIFHSGDWKIDENPVDGEVFDRTSLEQLSREGVTLLMSDSTNVLSPGRTISEADVRKAVVREVCEAKSRVISTQFASNIHRLGTMKAAADASGRKLVFIGTALQTYIDAAWKDGQAPFDPSTLVKAEDMGSYAPRDLLIVTTGSQAEPRSALNLASFGSSRLFKLEKDDEILYSAKMIPGNETRVMKMLNRISEAGATIVAGKDKNLHTSGHAYRDELEELIKILRPQHFLPVHGEYTFLKEHEQLGKSLGIHHTKVIKNGEMLGVSPLRNRRVLSSGFVSLGREDLQLMYNDGDKAFGTSAQLRVDERRHIAHDGIVIVSIEVIRDEDADASGSEYGLRARIRITSRCLWLDSGKLTDALYRAASAAVASCKQDAELSVVERTVSLVLRKVVQKYNNKRPDVIALATEKVFQPRDNNLQKRLVVDAAAQVEILVKASPMRRFRTEDKKPQLEKRFSMLRPEISSAKAVPRGEHKGRALQTGSSKPVSEPVAVNGARPQQTEEDRVKKTVAENVLNEMRKARAQKAERVEQARELQQQQVLVVELKDNEDEPQLKSSRTARKEVTTSKSKWNPQATQVLIHLRSGMDEKFKKAKLKTPLWKEIALKLAADHGYEYSHTQCTAMWATLVKRYKNLVEDDDSVAKDWPHFDEMRSYLSDDADS